MGIIHRFSLAEYDRMIECNAFDTVEDRRVELIYGALRELSPPGPLHEHVIDFLTRWCVQHTAADEVRVRIQNSIGIPVLDSAPQPDVALVREKSYRQGRPQPADVFLIIEVSETSLAYDRGIKAQLYAETGIQEYWIVDLHNTVLEVRRQPVNKAYTDIRVCHPGELVSPLAIPAAFLDPANLF